MEIDFTDFTILRCIYHQDASLWKKRIHECCLEYMEEPISVQTVGRRVDRLHTEELLQSSIMSPDNIDRDLIIGYSLTEKGCAAIARKRREILMRAVRAELFDGDGDHHDERLLYELAGEEFGFGHEDTPLGDYEVEELLTLIALYYSMEQAHDTFTADNIEKLIELAEQNQELANVLTMDLFSSDRLPNNSE